MLPNCYSPGGEYVCVTCLPSYMGLGLQLWIVTGLVLSDLCAAYVINDDDDFS